jgi:transposase
MSEQLTVTTERVDDIPILIASAERLGLAELLDEHFVAHGNWQGISPGKMLTGWLSHILSEADHRLNRVQDWAAKRLETLSGCLDVELSALDFSDDRLATGLDMLSGDERWASFEAALNRRALRVYDLKGERVRIDTTTGSGYWQVTEDGLFQRGYSKDHRPDLPQLKVVLATLDPMGMPVATQVVAGDKADDPLYIPAIDQVRTGVGSRGLLYIGDCKMMSLETRLHVVAGDDAYLGPFSQTHVSQDSLDSYLEPVWAGEQGLTIIERCTTNGKVEQIAEGFERCETLSGTHEGQPVTWVERRLMIHSLAHAKTAEAALYARLQQAKTAIEALPERKQGKEPMITAEALSQAAEKLLKMHDVAGMIQFQIVDQIQQQHVRKYKERPAETRIRHQLMIEVQLNEAAIQETIRRLGWRVYGTNASLDQLTLEQAVLAYREEYLVEHCFGRLKGKPLSLTPMFLEDDRRATGLTRLLSIGLRILTLLEHVARCHLAERNEVLGGLYAGNPTRATDRPTTEALLRAFKDIFLSFVAIDGHTYRHLSPLPELQQNILALLDLPTCIYTKLADSHNPP